MRLQFVFAFLFFSILTSTQVHAQEVEHNYLVGPQKTNCDSLDLNQKELKDKIAEIKQTNFRYTQHFTLNRKEGFQGGWYYSCDNEIGFLVVKRNNKWELYNGVSKATWQEFVHSGSFEKFIDERLK